ncbi:MAG TPA: MraY family glycosyltransferase, partial [Planctomycetota bacterium]|nr:MraY family glycosyltransferase [Planctomycetota bacterium]
MIGLYASLFAASFAVTALLVPIVMRVARRTGFLDQPGPRKIHTSPIPYGGGIAVAAGVLGAALGGTIPGGVPKTLLVISLGSLAILVLGLIDDRRRLSPGFKLLVQAIVATGVALGGERFELFDAAPALSVAVTVLWILGVTNAFNLLDHMDGLSSGVAFLSGAAFLVVALQTGQAAIGSMLVPLLGACAAFLLFNFPPARIFLGDAGSLFVGFWLSCLTVSFTFYDRAHFRLYTYFVPIAVLAVPLFDTASVIVIRLLRRRPIFEGDTNHLAHRLTRLGMSRRLAVLTIYALTLFAG